MKVINARGRVESLFETKIKDSMHSLRINRDTLSDKIFYNTGSNLMTAIKNRNLSDVFLVRLCKVLKLDLGDLFKLKVKDEE